MAKITTNISKESLKAWYTKADNGEITNDEWSRMTKALRLHLQRYLDKGGKK